MKVLKESKQLKESLEDFEVWFSYVTPDGEWVEDSISIPDDVVELSDTFEDDVKAYIVANLGIPEGDSNIELGEIQQGYDTIEKCDFCGEWYPDSEMHETDLGLLCDRCIDELKSRGEKVWVKQ